MFHYDYVLAAALLTTPVESPELVPHLELVQPTLLQLAIDAEILDPREEQYLHGLSNDLAGDCKAMRQRHDRLFRTPAVVECERLPPLKVIDEFLAFNRAYRVDLKAQFESNPVRAEALRTAIEDVDQLHHVWSTLREARCGFYYVMVRRQALQHLHDLVGAEAFYRAQLPPHVPIWQFQRMK